MCVIVADNVIAKPTKSSSLMKHSIPPSMIPPPTAGSGKARRHLSMDGGQVVKKLDSADICVQLVSQDECLAEQNRPRMTVIEVSAATPREQRVIRPDPFANVK